MNKSPLVTVIIPCYNHENYIEECVKSVIKQTYKNIELIILNDGSRDKSSEKILNLIDECKNRFVRFEFVDKLNEGVSKTLNQGIHWSKGEYISPLSSDDLIFPEKIEKLVELFEESSEKVGMICGDAIFIDDKGTHISLDSKAKTFYEYFAKDNYLQGLELDYSKMLQGNFLPGMSAMFRKEVLIDIGLYNEEISLEDWDLYLNLLKKYDIKLTKKIMAKYRWHESNTGKVSTKKIVLNQLMILKDNEQYCRKKELMKEYNFIYAKSLMDLLHIGAYKDFFYNFKILNMYCFLKLSISKIKKLIRS